MEQMYKLAALLIKVEFQGKAYKTSLVSGIYDSHNKAYNDYSVTL